METSEQISSSEVIDNLNTIDNESEFLNTIEPLENSINENLMECSNTSIVKRRGRKKREDNLSDNSTTPLSIDEDNLESSNITTAKKRGRKKNSTDEKCTDDNDEELLNIPIQKKRGRKKKEETACESIEETVVKTEVLDTPIPKKRGRKKKDPNTLKGYVIEEIEEEVVNEEELNCSLTPKKRGRKSKSEQLASEANSLDTEILDTQRSSRKRKTVNYLELSEGADMTEADKIYMRKQSDFCDDNMLEIDANISYNSDSDIDCEYTTVSRPRKRKKQSKQNNLLTSLLTEAKLADSVADIPTSTKRGRPKVSDADASNSESSFGESVVCAVCNKEFTKLAWSNHKLRYHNNLAWRVGDPPLDLNDQALVISILSAVYKKRKPLHCEICGQSKKSVIGFLSHKSVCKKSGEEITAMQVQCEHCLKYMMPVSMPMHLKYCRVLNKDKLESEMRIVEKSNDIIDPVMGKRKAASKALEIINSIKKEGEPQPPKPTYSKNWVENFNFVITPWAQECIEKQITQNGTAKCSFEECKFESDEVMEIFNHFQICDKKINENYTCKICLLTFEVKENLLQHLNAIHGKSIKEEVDEKDFECEEESEEDEDTDDENKGSLFTSKMMSIIDAQTLKYKVGNNIPFAYPLAKDWALKFCNLNYSIENLFSKWKNCLAEKLNSELIINYLPINKYSISTAEIGCTEYINPLSIDHEWKRYKLFESSIENDVATIFCGGPVSSMAWIPTPHNKTDCEQILAVATFNDPDKEYELNELCSEPGLIQFWSCGLLDTETNFQLPKLEFAIAHDHTPIWCLEWCPSGCYNLKSSAENANPKRLGLLAVGCGDSQIYLYSVCLPELGGKIFKLKPVVKLLFSSDMEKSVRNLKPHVTKLSWSKVLGHQRLVGGYANGMVAIFNLHTTSTLLRRTDNDDIETILPYKVINCHSHAITALSLYHLSNGSRWLMTGSIDRSVKYWDLENSTVPVSSYSKFPITDGVWLNHWLSSLHCFDNSCLPGTSTTVASHIRNLKLDVVSLLHSNSTVCSITGSEWSNGFIQGNVAGELLCIFPNQLYCGMENEKSLKRRKAVLSYNRLVDKNLSVAERLEKDEQETEVIESKPKTFISVDEINSKACGLEPKALSFKESEEKYGLVFCNYKLNDMSTFSSNLENYKINKFDKYYRSPPNAYPMQAINKVSFNPNKSSFDYCATGYKAGFVKIHRLKFLRK